MGQRWSLMAIVAILLMLGGIRHTQLQAQDDACPELVEFALASVNDICDALDRNRVCYGNFQVDATFNADVPVNYFSQPADVAPIIDLATLQTAAYNLADGIWGVAIMNIQADLPNTLPGQAVTIILLGDTEIQNQVTPEQAFIPADPITVTTIASASNIRANPTTTSLALGSVPAGTEFATDARSADGEWLRVIFDDRPAWLNINLINSVDGLDMLPSLQAGQFTPMQAFTFNTGIGQSTCSSAPNSLMIQGPENIDVTINANGADITIGSTIVLRTSADNRMQLLTVSGAATIDGFSVPAGFTVEAELNQEGRAISGALSGFRPLSDEELEALDVIERFDRNLLQYDVRVPSRAQIARLQNAIVDRETAIRQCSAANLTQQQCLQIIGSDGDLQNRFLRCVDFGLPEELCRSVIGGDLSASTVALCLSQGFTTADACREVTQENNTNELLAFCQTIGAASQQECQAMCEAQGYDTLASCQAALEAQTANPLISISPPQQSPTQQQIANFCQSLGATNQSECVQICNNNGFTTLTACWLGMG